MPQRDILDNESAQVLNDMAKMLYERCCQIAFVGELAEKMKSMPVGSIMDVQLEDLRRLRAPEIKLLLGVYDATLDAAVKMSYLKGRPS